MFPGLSAHQLEIWISHSDSESPRDGRDAITAHPPALLVVETVFSKVPMTRTRRRDISTIVYSTKPWPQKRAQLLNAGFKSILEDIEVLLSEGEAAPAVPRGESDLSRPVDDSQVILERLQKLNGESAKMRAAFEDVDRTKRMALAMGVTRPIVFKPLIMLNQPYFKEGVMLEVRAAKRSSEVIARGGR